MTILQTVKSLATLGVRVRVLPAEASLNWQSGTPWQTGKGVFPVDL